MEARYRERRELECAADELLSADAREHGRGDYPWYSERWMELLGRREQPGVDEMPAPESAGAAHGRLARLVVDADLTRRQRLVIRGLARGLSQREIAARLGLSEAQVCRIKQAALARLRAVGEVP